MTTTLSIPLTSTESEHLRTLATEWKTTPDAIVGAFVADLTASVRSAGSDERMLARAWFDQSCVRAMGDQPQRFIERWLPEIEIVNAIRALGQQAETLLQRDDVPVEEWEAISAQAEQFDRQARPGLSIGRMVWFDVPEAREMYLVDGIGDEKVHVVHVPFVPDSRADAVDPNGWCLRSVVEEKLRQQAGSP